MWHCNVLWIMITNDLSILKKRGCWVIVCLMHNPTPNNATFNTIHMFSYIVAVSFIGGGNWSTQRKPPTCRTFLERKMIPMWNVNSTPNCLILNVLIYIFIFKIYIYIYIYIYGTLLFPLKVLRLSKFIIHFIKKNIFYLYLRFKRIGSTILV